MKYRISMVMIAVIASCTTARLPVTDTFSNQATKLPVRGINGWQVNQKLQFGAYITSKIKRGWDFYCFGAINQFRINPEEAILKVF